MLVVIFTIHCIYFRFVGRLKNLIFIVSILSFIYSDINSILLEELYDPRTSWKLYSREVDEKNIYLGEGINDDILFIKIEQKVKYNKESIFTVLKDIGNYNKIVSNKNLFSYLIETESDTIFAHQLVTNVVPFIRNRQYVFKMYMVNEKRLDWILLDAENPIMKSYVGKNVHNLYYGAGSWYINDNNILSYQMYIDDETRIPDSFIKKIKINSAKNIFNDMLNHLGKNKGK